MGTCSVDIGNRPRTRHRAELALAVSAQFWNRGVGTRLMEECISRVVESQDIEVLACVVRCDNDRAIRLYERFGLEQTGVLRGVTKVGGQLCDAIVMSRVFHRDRAMPDKPLFYLGDLLDAMDSASDNLVWYACMDTCEVELSFENDWLGEGGFDPETAEGRWECLPDRFEIDDWG